VRAACFSLQPIYDPSTFDPNAIATATSFAALTYIGFDGLTTLAEDVENPRRNVPLATVAVCLFTALFSCVLVYLAQLIFPDYHAFADIETAFMDVTRQSRGRASLSRDGIVVILSSFGCSLGRRGRRRTRATRDGTGTTFCRPGSSLDWMPGRISGAQHCFDLADGLDGVAAPEPRARRGAAEFGAPTGLYGRETWRHFDSVSLKEVAERRVFSMQ